MTLIQKAKELASKAHAGQTRKLSTEPYFIHPEAVATILQQAGLSEEVVASGYLHDTVEDTEITLATIRETFGEKVATIVAGNTEDKSKTWEERKQHTIDTVKTASFDVKCLVAADKLDNLKSLIKASNEASDEIWSYFKRGKEKQAWYYTNIANALFENLKEDEIPEFFRDYQKLVHDFFE
ncbi:HD domain-containing protein [Bacillus sp. AK128]